MKKSASKLSPHSLGYLTGSISQALADRLRKNFREEGLELAHAQFVLLLDLFLEDGQTQQSLARKVFKDKAAIKRSVDNLVAHGWVRREEATSSRNNPIWLTHFTRSQETLLRKVAARTIKEATKDIEPQEIECCLAVLRKLHLSLVENAPSALETT